MTFAYLNGHRPLPRLRITHLHLDVGGVYWKFNYGQKGGKAQNKRSPLWGEGVNGRKKKAEGKYVANCLLCWNRVIGGQRLGLDLSTNSGRQGIKLANS